MSGPLVVSVTSRLFARICPSTKMSRHRSVRLNGRFSSSTAWSSILLISRMSLISVSRWLAATLAFSRFWLFASASSGCCPLSSKSPRMPLSGVRMSWLMRERNAVLAALASCALRCALRALCSAHARMAMTPTSNVPMPARMATRLWSTNWANSDCPSE